MSSLRTSRQAGRGRGVGADAIEAAVRRFFAPSGAPPARGARRRMAERWKRTLRRLRPLGEVSSGNRVEVLDDGDRAFERMWEAIAAARARIAMDTYILCDDRVGRRTLDELVAAARRGVQVLLVYDAIGSAELDGAFCDPLREAGGRVLVFNPFWGPRRRWPRLVRDHRKILAVDGAVAFCGGMNVGEEYAGPRLGTNVFRDTHLRLEGPGARALEALVLDVAATLGTRLAPSPPGPQAADGVLLQVLESNVRRQRQAIQKALRLTVDRSQERCWLTSPYFVPPGRLLRALERAARRGVDVRVLTAGRSDVPAVRVASRHLYGRLLRRGVRIFEFHERTLHAKVVCVDGLYSSVGSFNLDPWSWRRNLEVTVGALDRALCTRLGKRFEADLEGAVEIDAEGWERRSLPGRVLQWLAWAVLRL